MQRDLRKITNSSYSKKCGCVEIMAKDLGYGLQFPLADCFIKKTALANSKKLFNDSLPPKH